MASKMSRYNVRDAKIVSRTELEGKDAKWTRLRLIRYTDPAGKSKTFESAERSTRSSTSPVDAVGVVAIIKGAEPKIVLQRQFRPPVGKVVVEIPAGLVDEGERPEQAALRELKEETGYIGTLVNTKGESIEVPKEGEVKGVMFNDPGFTNTNLTLVQVEIDPEREENKPENLSPELEENEFIETFTLELDRLWSECRRWEESGLAIDARVATIAEGWEMRRRFFK